MSLCVETVKRSKSPVRRCAPASVHWFIAAQVLLAAVWPICWHDRQALLQMALADLKSKRFLTRSPVKGLYVWQQRSHLYGCSGCNHRRLWWALQVYYSILQSVWTVLSIKQALSKAVKTFPYNSTSDKGCKSHRRNRTSVMFVSYDWMRLKLFADLIPYANMCEPSPGKVLQRFMEPLPEITSSWIHITRIIIIRSHLTWNSSQS